MRIHSEIGNISDLMPFPDSYFPIKINSIISPDISVSYLPIPNWEHL